MSACVHVPGLAVESQMCPGPRAASNIRKRTQTAPSALICSALMGRGKKRKVRARLKAALHFSPHARLCPSPIHHSGPILHRASRGFLQPLQCCSVPPTHPASPPSISPFCYSRPTGVPRCLTPPTVTPAIVGLALAPSWVAV